MARPTQVPFERLHRFRLRGYHPLWLTFPGDSASKQLGNSHVRGPTTPQRKTSAVWAISFSLAATGEIEFSFYSNGYLDVSVHRVRDVHLCIQCTLIRESRDQRSFDNYPGLIAVFHALHRLLTPRHPPCALSSLATWTKPSYQPGPLPLKRTQGVFESRTTWMLLDQALHGRLPYRFRHSIQVTNASRPPIKPALTARFDRRPAKCSWNRFDARSLNRTSHRFLNETPLVPQPNCQRTYRATHSPEVVAQSVGSTGGRFWSLSSQNLARVHPP